MGYVSRLKIPSSHLFLPSFFPPSLSSAPTTISPKGFCNSKKFKLPFGKIYKIFPFVSPGHCSNKFPNVVFVFFDLPINPLSKNGFSHHFFWFFQFCPASPFFSPSPKLSFPKGYKRSCCNISIYSTLCRWFVLVQKKSASFCITVRALSLIPFFSKKPIATKALSKKII